MQLLEVSGAVRHLYGSLGVKGLMYCGIVDKIVPVWHRDILRAVVKTVTNILFPYIAFRKPEVRLRYTVLVS